MNEDLNLQMESGTGAARPVAPEDLRPGDYVTALHVITEECAAPWEREPGQPVVARFACLPDKVAPALVLEVCLPFALVQTAEGKARVIDVRRYRLARVAETFGRLVFARLADDRKAEQATGGDRAEKTSED